MQQAFENRLKRKLKEGKKTAGGWLQICSPFTFEIVVFSETFQGGFQNPKG